MEILRIGETTHGKDFCVLREQGYPFYMLLLVETPALLETDGEMGRDPRRVRRFISPRAAAELPRRGRKLYRLLDAHPRRRAPFI